MNPPWCIVFYETKDGRCPVQEFIDSRKEREQAKIVSWISQLKKEGPNLPRPYADFLAEGIHELRIKLSGEQVRIFYFFCFKDFIVLTHTHKKHTDKIPLSETNRAKSYRADFLNRFDEQKLKERFYEKF